MIGWDLQVFVQSTATDAALQGSLTLLRGFKSGGSSGTQTIDEWSVGEGGIVFIPCPVFDLDFIDKGAAGGGNSSVLLIGATAVYAGELPTGGSRLYGFSLGNIGAGATATFTAPKGSTGYLVRPAEAITSDLAVTERSNGTDVAVYLIDGSTTPSEAGKISGFIRIPDRPSADIQVKNLDGSNDRKVSIRWEWNLRALL